MSRYDAPGIEAEFEPGSRRRVLRNLLGIRLAGEMSRAESAALLQAQEHLVDSFSLEHRFAARDICEMHRVPQGKWYF